MTMWRIIAIIALFACAAECSAAPGAVPRLRPPCEVKRIEAAEAMGEAVSPMYASPAARAAFRALAAVHVEPGQFEKYKAEFLRRGEVVTNVIDVMIAFDRSAERWVGENWQGSLESFAGHCLDKMNRVLENTGLDGYFTFNLVSAPVVDVDVVKEYVAFDTYEYADGYVEQVPHTDFSTALDDAAGKTAESKRSKFAAAWKALRTERDISCADVVSVLVGSERQGTVGLAYALDELGIRSADYMSDVAYSMVCIGTTSEDWTQLHEIGHLMGAGHSDELDLSYWLYPELLGPQLFPYSSSAYFDASFPTDWSDWRYTVMGYNYPGPSWIDKDGYVIYAAEEPCFSSPLLFAENGAAKGDEAHDNARTLRETYALVANYRVRRIPPNMLFPADGDVVTVGSRATNIAVQVESSSGLKVSVKGLPSGLKFDSKTMSIVGKPTKPGVYAVTVSLSNALVPTPVTRTFTIDVKFPVVTVEKDGRGTGKVTGDGAYAEEKKVTLKATADKGSVFMGWFETAASTDPISQAASLSFIMGEADVQYTARFITAQEDVGSIAATVGEFSFDAETAAATTNVPCGVALRWPVAARALSAATVKVAGLPSGLKFTAKNIMKKGSKTEVDIPANTIYGAPTAASKIDKNTGASVPSAVKVTVTTAGKSSKTFVLYLTVDPFPAWAVGNFFGSVAAVREGGNEKAPAGTVSLTIATSGKISGKLIEGEKTWTLSATSFDAVDCRPSNVGDNEAGSPVFLATVVGKAGKEFVTNEIAVAAEKVAEPGGREAMRGVVNTRTSSLSPVQNESDSPRSLTAWQNLWKNEPWKTVAKPFAKAPTLDVRVGGTGAASVPGVVTLKFASSGAVTAKGVFITGYDDKKKKDITYSARCSSVLIPVASMEGQTSSASASSFFVCLYFPPKAGKFDGCATIVGVEWTGSSFKLR